MVIMNKKNTLTELREWMEEYRKYIMNLDQIGDRIVQVLTLRDNIHNIVHTLEKKGADLSVEKSKLDSLDHIIKDKPRVVWRKLKKHVDPMRYRSEQHLSPAHWWWYLDHIIQKEKKKRTDKWIRRLAIGAAALVGLYLILTYAVPKPSPYIILLAEADELLEKGQINTALEIYQEAIHLDPDDPTGYLMTGVIYQFLVEGERAQTYFAEAKKRHRSLYDFYLQRGMVWLKMGQFAAAEEDGKKTLEINFDSAEAHFLLGNVYEAQDKIVQAIEEFSIVSELDADPKLTVISRFKMGMISLRRMATLPQRQQ